MKILATLILAVVVTNPLTNQYIVLAVNQALYYVTFAAPYTAVALLVYTLVLSGIYYERHTRVKLPSKHSKTTPQKYIKTSNR